jgi:hypothetical protein
MVCVVNCSNILLVPNVAVDQAPACGARRVPSGGAAWRSCRTVLCHKHEPECKKNTDADEQQDLNLEEF